MHDHPQASTSNATLINCPVCEKPTVYHQQNPYRPFCSERCQTLDLGAWANEQRTIAGKTEYDTINLDPSDSNEL